MGWRGILRSMAAESRRSAREYEREQKRLAKKAALEDAIYEVEEFEEGIKSLITLHHTCLADCDWEKIEAELPPVAPEKLYNNELKAEQQLSKFKPNIFHKLFKLTESKLHKLKLNIVKAQEKDIKEYEEKIDAYKRDFLSWEKSQKLARGVREGDFDSYIEALKTINPYDEMDDFVKKVEFSPKDKQSGEVTVFSRGQDIIPNEVKSLMSSGRVSTKKMPSSRFYEIYQDHICSCALRVARELFAALPLETVCITVLERLVSAQTGHLEDQPILSVIIHKKTLEGLEFLQLDPSSSMRNFICNMNFKKTTGFEPVEKLSLEKVAKK